VNTGFVLFGPSHLTVLFLIAAAGLFLSQIVRVYPRTIKIIYIILASILLSTLTGATVYRFSQGILPPQGLPLHISDITAIIVFITLVTRKQWCFEISYYWGFSAGSLALLTPDFQCAVTCISSIMYILIHGVVVISVMIFVWGEKRRPGAGSNIRAFVALNGYAVMMGVFDVIFKTNYFFMLYKPQGETLLDLFGPWPFYILVTDVFSFVLFFLLWLPYSKIKFKIRQIQNSK
jgi:hypothetical integral membrane protein (TIGR02206 family)